jgi:hypothetical protein
MMASEMVKPHYESTPNLEYTHNISFRNRIRVNYSHAASIIDTALG